MIQYLREILYLLGSARRKLPWLGLLFLCSSLLDFLGIGLVGPYVALVVDPRALQGRFGSLIETLGLPRNQRDALVLMGLALLGIFAVKAVAAIAINAAIVGFGQGQRARLQSLLMDAYQRLPYVEYVRRNSSEYAHAIGTLTTEFAYLLQIGLRATSDGIVAFVVLILLALQNAAALALLSVLLFVVIYGYDRLFRARLRAYGESAANADLRVTRGLREGIDGLKEIRILGKEGHFHAVVHEAAREHARHFTRAQVMAGAPRYVLEVAMVGFVVLLVFLILWKGQDLDALVPTLGVFAVAALRLMPALNTISGGMIQLRYGRASVSRLYRDVRALEGVRLEPSADDIRPRAFEKLVLDRVRFTYPDSSKVALEVSMEIRAEESIGLIGPSGSGKTTLVDVLLGLLEPQQGEIRYNGRPLRESLGEWRAQVAYLPQEVFLTDDSLRHNIALGVKDGEVDGQRLKDAIQQARLADLVAQWPEGDRTAIGEHGMRLSGGQRQRVALARAFYHGRSVLVMDEATSALDNETEREIVEEIRRLRGHKTLIVIAHRLTTVEHCDRIYRLDEGRIAESGSYDEVVRAHEA